MKVQAFIKIGDSLIESEGDIIEAISESMAKKITDQHLARGLISVPEHIALQTGGYFRTNFGTTDREVGFSVIIDGDFTEEEVRQLSSKVHGVKYTADGELEVLHQHRFKIDIENVGVSGKTLTDLRTVGIKVEPRHDKPIPKSKLIDKVKAK